MAEFLSYLVVIIAIVMVLSGIRAMLSKERNVTLTIPGVGATELNSTLLVFVGFAAALFFIPGILERTQEVGKLFDGDDASIQERPTKWSNFPPISERRKVEIGVQACKVGAEERDRQIGRMKDVEFLRAGEYMHLSAKGEGVPYGNTIHYFESESASAATELAYFLSKGSTRRFIAEFSNDPKPFFLRDEAGLAIYMVGDDCHERPKY